MTLLGYSTRGRRSGTCGHVHGTEAEARACLDAHKAEQAALGLTSDRRVVPRSSPGRRADEGAARELQVSVRLTPDESAVLDAVRGPLSRAGWFRAQLPKGGTSG